MHLKALSHGKYPFSARDLTPFMRSAWYHVIRQQPNKNEAPIARLEIMCAVCVTEMLLANAIIMTQQFLQFVYTQVYLP